MTEPIDISKATTAQLHNYAITISGRGNSPQGKQEKAELDTRLLIDIRASLKLLEHKARMEHDATCPGCEEYEHGERERQPYK